jgi:hypothetical protein
MIRKVLSIATAIGLPLGLITATGGSAGAGETMVNATNNVVTCQQVSGSARSARLSPRAKRREPRSRRSGRS